ncbi:MAG TPA: helix-turn-helix domain-containing protein [Capillimicrobium sp.]|nr:helix-turn-helix domain-containing protein [Capillimicrobium sp.]
MSDTIDDTDVRFAKAMAHPIRRRVLQIFNERVASPSEIARELDLPVQNVSHHVQALLKLECIEQVEHRYVRGAIEHRYRAVRQAWAGLEDVEAMPPSVRQSVCGEILEKTVRDATAALTAGTVTKRADYHWSVIRGELDDEAFRRIHDMLDETLIAIEAEQAAARARIAAGAEKVPWRFSMLHYEAPDTD